MDISSDVGTSSPASSPSSSVFSYDAASSQSCATSVSSSSAGGAWDSDDAAAYPSNTSQLATISARHRSARVDSFGEVVANRPRDDYDSSSQRDALPPSPQLQPREEIPISARQNPRRTRPQSRTNLQNGCLEGSNSRPPPSLVRQNVRKDNFVDGLVGEHVLILLYEEIGTNGPWVPRHDDADD